MIQRQYPNQFQTAPRADTTRAVQLDNLVMATINEAELLPVSDTPVVEFYYRADLVLYWYVYMCHYGLVGPSQISNLFDVLRMVPKSPLYAATLEFTEKSLFE